MVLFQYSLCEPVTKTDSVCDVHKDHSENCSKWDDQVIRNKKRFKKNIYICQKISVQGNKEIGLDISRRFEKHKHSEKDEIDYEKGRNKIDDFLGILIALDEKNSSMESIPCVLF